MTIISAVQYVQIPLLAAMLLGGCSAKLVQVVRVGSVETALGPTALFPMRMRRPLALVMCGVECGLGIGLIVTAGQAGRGGPVICVRLGAALLFTVATCALIELRTSRPDVGCGCFGDFSGAPVTGRSLVRSALLAVAALVTVALPPLRQAAIKSDAAQLLIILIAELIVIGALSPEVGEWLVRLGYSDPCELRVIPAARTLTALRRSKQWRRHAGVITADVPADMWRELCWRYVVYPSRVDGREAQLIFAVYLRQRRPPIHVALVDAISGRVRPWPTVRAPLRPPGLRPPGRPAPPGRPGPAGRTPVPVPGLAAARQTSAPSHLPFSSEL